MPTFSTYAGNKYLEQDAKDKHDRLGQNGDIGTKEHAHTPTHTHTQLRTI